MNKTKRQAAKRKLKRMMASLSALERFRLRKRQYRKPKPITREKARPGYFFNEYGFEEPNPQKRDQTQTKIPHEREDVLLSLIDNDQR